VGISSAPVAPGDNAILRRLSERELRSVMAQSQIITLEDRRVLGVPGQPVRDVYFPLTSAVAGLAVLSDGQSVEALTVGVEGMVGLSITLPGQDASLRWEVVVPGSAVRVPSAVLRHHLAGTNDFPVACRAYTGVVLHDLVETMACNALHSLSERYARWLLLLRDRCAEPVLPVTQERAAEVLGVSRQSISAVSVAFQREGLIDHTRGRIQVVDREGLKGKSCSCYEGLNGWLKLSTRGVFLPG